MVGNITFLFFDKLHFLSFMLRKLDGLTNLLTTDLQKPSK